MSRYETLIRETNPGIYIHVPFCAAKCPYCNFYSVKAEESLMDAYTEQICRALAASARALAAPGGYIVFWRRHSHFAGRAAH